MCWTHAEAWHFITNLIQLGIILVCLVSVLLYAATHGKHGRLYQDGAALRESEHEQTHERRPHP